LGLDSIPLVIVSHGLVNPQDVKQDGSAVEEIYERVETLFWIYAYLKLSIQCSRM